MSELAKELTAILDKVGSILPTNSISIQESGKDAKLTELQLSSKRYELENLPSAVLCKELWKGRHRDDFDCDGIVLMTDLEGGETQLLLVELKSVLTWNQLQKAIRQIVISLLKIHGHFSLCKSYTGTWPSVKVLICCSTDNVDGAKLKNQSIANDGKLSKIDKIYRALLTRPEERRLITLSDILTGTNWLPSNCLQPGLLSIPLEIQLLVSHGAPVLKHQV